MSLIAISAGMLVDLLDEPVEVIETAARADFDGVGLRFVGTDPTAATLTAVRRHLHDTGLELLDVEVLRLVPKDRTAQTNARVMAIACELQPRYLTILSWEHDRGRVVEWLNEVCERVNPAGVTPALEFMPFTGVRTFEQARSIVEEVGVGRACVLVDNLHITRSGDEPEILRDVAAEMIPLVQLSDAAAQPPADDDALFHEALAERVLPGEGGLPIDRFLRALPTTSAISIEVLSDKLVAALPPDARATAARRAVTVALQNTRIGRNGSS